MKDNAEEILKLQKKAIERQLNLIDLETIESENEELSPEDISNRASEADLFYQKWFKKYMARSTLLYLKEMGGKGTVPVTLSFYNGILYGFQIIDDWFKKQKEISRDKPHSEEPNNGIKPIGENPFE